MANILHITSIVLRETAKDRVNLYVAVALRTAAEVAWAIAGPLPRPIRQAIDAKAELAFERSQGLARAILARHAWFEGDAL